MKRITIKIILVAYFCSLGPGPQARGEGIDLPGAGRILSLSSTYLPVMVKGLLVHPKEVNV